jgi:hypothetical protein
MTRLILDQGALAKLRGVSEPTLICDQAGKVLGQYQPLSSADLYRCITVPFSDEELERAAAEPGGRPLEAILKDLEKLP